MKTYIFSLRDVVLGEFGKPMHIQSEGVAIRSLADEVNKSGSESDLRNHPKDFSLYRVGEFDTENGVLTGYPQPIFVIDAVSLQQ